MIKSLFNNQAKNITLAAYILAASSLVSALLGLIRDRLLAGRFGAGEYLDIYYAAFRIPNLVFGLLISGGIIAAFLPVFSKYFEKDKDEAWRLANIVLNSFFMMMAVVCGVLFFATPFLIKYIAPGFDLSAQHSTVILTRIMFLSTIFFAISNIFAGILQYFRRFLVYAMAPILYNLGIIFGILFLEPSFKLQGLAYGVVLGALLHCLIQMPAVFNTGLNYKVIFDFKCPGLKKIFKLMVPRSISAAIFHINLIVVTAIASTLGAGSIAVFNFSDHLGSIPVGVIGASFAVAAYPFLAKSWAEKAKDKFLNNLSSAFRQTLFLVVPISVLMFLLRAQIVRLILGTGKFGWEDTQLTTACLGLFCFGIFAYSLIPFLSRVFFSLHDTKTPLLIGVATVSMNIFLSFWLVSLLKSVNAFSNFLSAFLDLEKISSITIIGLPLAISLSGIFQLILLLIFLYKKIGDFRIKEISNSFFKISLATVLMALFIYPSLFAIEEAVNTHTGFGLFVQTLAVSLIGFFIYFFTARNMKLPEAIIFYSRLTSFFKKTRTVTPSKVLPEIKEGAGEKIE